MLNFFPYLWIFILFCFCVNSGCIINLNVLLHKIVSYNVCVSLSKINILALYEGFEIFFIT